MSYDVILFTFTASVANVFQLPDESEFDLVVNCAGETKLGQSESVSQIDI